MSEQGKTSRRWPSKVLGRFEDTTARALTDIRNGQVEGYATFILGLGLGIVGAAARSTNLMLAAVIIELSFLVYNFNISARAGAELDKVLEDRKAYADRPFSKRLRGVKRLYLQGASLVHLLNGDNLNAIIDEILVHADGEVRILLQDPDSKEAMEFLRRQLDEATERKSVLMHEALPQVLSRLQNLGLVPPETAAQKFKGKIEVRFLTFSPGFSLVLIDPNERKGVVIPELYGFRNDETGKRMHIEITRQDSEYWFDYWEKQFDAMWESQYALDFYKKPLCDS